MNSSRRNIGRYDGYSHDQYFCLKALPVLWIAALVLYELIRRTPAGSDGVRWIWISPAGK
jgi:hypothetical protein